MVPALEIYMKSNCRMECSKKKKKMHRNIYVIIYMYIYILVGT